MPLDAARDAVITVQARVIEALATGNARLAGQVAGLAARVERLERLASRNSGNSSMPPSADDLPGRTPPRRKQARGGGKRKHGKQPGAPGSHLAWSEHPDDTVRHFPEGTCECGAALASAAGLGVVASHQQIEIPLASAQVIQHDLHAVACGCGRVHQAAASAGAGPAGTVTYGLNLQAWCVFLMAAPAEIADI
jgi:transposase